MASLSTLFIGLGVSAISAATILATTGSIGPLLAASLTGGLVTPPAGDEPRWIDVPAATCPCETPLQTTAASLGETVSRDLIEQSIYSPGERPTGPID